MEHIEQATAAPGEHRDVHLPPDFVRLTHAEAPGGECYFCGRRTGGLCRRVTRLHFSESGSLVGLEMRG